jgi:putative endopeptidase
MKPSTLALAGAVLLAAGCARLTPGTPASRGAPGERPPAAPAAASEPQAPGPTRNFYEWVNEDWLKSTPIPPDKPGVSNFLLIQVQVNKDLESLLTSLKGKPEKSADERKLAVLFGAYMDMKRRNALGISPLSSELRRIDRAKNHDDIAVLFARMQTLGVEAPLAFAVSTDFKKSDRYIVFVSQAGLGIEREDYLGEDERSGNIRRAYQEVVQKMFELASVKDAAGRARSVLELERQLAVFQWSNVDNRDIAKIYNVTDFKGLTAKARNIKIERQLPVLRMPSRYPFNVMQPSYVEAFNEFFTT